MKTPFFQTVRAIIIKDLRAEFRSRELISSMALFTLLSILIFSFALELDRQVREEAVSGVLWVTVVFASILGFNRSMGMESDQGNLDAMLLAPIERSAIFIGKLIGNYVFSVIIGLVMLPLMTVLYNIPVAQPLMVVVLLLGTFGFSVIGTLLATMTVQTRSREAMLPIIMMPVALPILLSAVKASNGIISSAPLEQWGAWPQIVAVIDFIYLGLCFLLYDFVIEE